MRIILQKQVSVDRVLLNSRVRATDVGYPQKLAPSFT